MVKSLPAAKPMRKIYTATFPARPGPYKNYLEQRAEIDAWIRDNGIEGYSYSSSHNTKQYWVVVVYSEEDAIKAMLSIS